mgnify:CR=1 FL=1
MLFIDEKPLIQAVERKDSRLPLSPGRAERHGFCCDDAVVESVVATLAFELHMIHDWPMCAEACCASFRYIEMWYNRKQRHSPWPRQHRALRMRSCR